MATYLHLGDVIDYTPSSAVSAGDVVVIGNIVGVATEDIAADDLGSLAIEGVFSLAKATLSTSAITQGTKLYWDASGEQVTETEGSNKVAGYATKAASASDTTVEVKLARA
jgi:predicted RecA/RadA family phage recombinase